MGINFNGFKKVKYKGNVRRVKRLIEHSPDLYKIIDIFDGMTEDEVIDFFIEKNYFKGYDQKGYGEKPNRTLDDLIEKKYYGERLGINSINIDDENLFFITEYDPKYVLMFKEREEDYRIASSNRFDSAKYLNSKELHDFLLSKEGYLPAYVDLLNRVEITKFLRSYFLYYLDKFDDYEKDIPKEIMEVLNKKLALNIDNDDPSFNLFEVVPYQWFLISEYLKLVNEGEFLGKIINDLKMINGLNKKDPSDIATLYEIIENASYPFLKENEYMHQFAERASEVNVNDLIEHILKIYKIETDENTDIIQLSLI